jgi:penicillin amidase
MEKSPLISRVIIWIALPLALTMLFWLWNIYGAFPQYSGFVNALGLNQDVVIHRDKWGIPNINSRHNNDLYFAMGYVHAQDRMWQMDFQRHKGKGNLSSMLGAVFVNDDRFYQSLGLEKLATENLSSLNQQTKDSIQAYTNGVNQWINNQTKLPPEYESLNLIPEVWTSIDSVLIFKLFQFELDNSFTEELQNLSLLKLIGKPLFEAILQEDIELPGYSAATTLTNIPGAELLSLTQQTQTLSKPYYTGSNAWALSGNMTESGSPILAFDPHMSLSLPSRWYVVKQSINDMDISGVTIPGVPFIISGNNNLLAWGMTAMQADTQDLFVLRTHPYNSNQYLYEGDWLDFESFALEVDIRQDFPRTLKPKVKPVRWTARNSVFGPVISDLSGSYVFPMALKWQGFESEDRSLQGLMEMNFAGNLDTFNLGLSLINSPAVVLVYADKQDNIALLPGGNVPVRENGSGVLPAPGWTSEFDWRTSITATELPRETNPNSNYVIATNHQWFDSKKGPQITGRWNDGKRKERIITLLESSLANDAKVTTEETTGIQSDAFVSYFDVMQPHWQEYQFTETKTEKGRQILSDWDGIADIDSVAATIHSGWFRELLLDSLQALLEEEQGHLSRQQLTQILEWINPNYYQRIIALADTEECFIGNEPSLEACSEKFEHSLTMAITELEKLLGYNMDKWQWKRAHKLVLEPYGGNQTSLLTHLTSFAKPASGYIDAINLSSMQFDLETGFIKTHGANYRQIVDLGNDDLQIVLNTGQSGNPLSPHYLDMYRLMNQNQLISTSESFESIEHILTLKAGLNN